jgi:hypothetical protein
VCPCPKGTLPFWLSSCFAAGFEDTGDVLLLALDADQDLVALSIQDREAILRVLDDPPAGLAELRGVLLGEHEWRVRTGLVLAPASARQILGPPFSSANSGHSPK